MFPFNYYRTDNGVETAVFAYRWEDEAQRVCLVNAENILFLPVFFFFLPKVIFQNHRGLMLISLEILCLFDFGTELGSFHIVTGKPQKVLMVQCRERPQILDSILRVSKSLRNFMARPSAH